MQQRYVGKPVDQPDAKGRVEQGLNFQFRFVRRNKTNLFTFNTHKTYFLSKSLVVMVVGPS